VVNAELIQTVSTVAKNANKQEVLL
jgi:hypothetical protein